MSQVKAMSAVERIESLLDAGSFIEIGASVMQEIRILTCRRSRRRQMA